MLLSRSQTLEDKIVQTLWASPLQIKDLHARVGKSVSLRAVYKAVSSLIKASVLIKVGKTVWVDQEWVQSLRERFSETLPLIGPGERVAYTFASLEHLDAFWKTVALQLEGYEREEQPFFYNPHNFWAYLPERKASEDAYYARFLRDKKSAYFTVGGTTVADREFKQAYQNKFFQIDARPIIGFGRRNHITVYGNFVITARLSTLLAARLDTLYESGKPLGKLLPEIISTCAKPESIRLVFEHNAGKAKKITNVLSANFYLPR